jgi:hypothetical protein
MDDTDPELESGTQPAYARFLRPADQLCVNQAVTQQYLQAQVYSARRITVQITAHLRIFLLPSMQH